MRDKLQISTFILFALVLATSVIYNVTRQVSLVNWPEIILVLLILFVAIGDKITKMVISPKEVSIEQRTVEQTVENFQKDIQKIDRFVEEDQPADKITILLATL